MPPTLEEMEAETRSHLGKKYWHEVVLADGEIRRLEGVVKEVPYRGGTRVTLQYTGWKNVGDDPNWNTPRQHYPWKESAHVP
jgi:hypothetical protein